MHHTVERKRKKKPIQYMLNGVLYFYPLLVLGTGNVGHSNVLLLMEIRHDAKICFSRITVGPAA